MTVLSERHGQTVIAALRPHLSPHQPDSSGVEGGVGDGSFAAALKCSELGDDFEASLVSPPGGHHHRIHGSHPLDDVHALTSVHVGWLIWFRGHRYDVDAAVSTDLKHPAILKVGDAAIAEVVQFAIPVEFAPHHRPLNPGGAGLRVLVVVHPVPAHVERVVD